MRGKAEERAAGVVRNAVDYFIDDFLLILSVKRQSTTQPTVLLSKSFHSVIIE